MTAIGLTPKLRPSIGVPNDVRKVRTSDVEDEVSSEPFTELAFRGLTKLGHIEKSYCSNKL